MTLRWAALAPHLHGLGSHTSISGHISVVDECALDKRPEFGEPQEVASLQ
jgi:hypothetical protein